MKVKTFSWNVLHFFLNRLNNTIISNIFTSLLLQTTKRVLKIEGTTFYEVFSVIKNQRIHRNIGFLEGYIFQVLLVMNNKWITWWKNKNHTIILSLSNIISCLKSSTLQFSLFSSKYIQEVSLYSHPQREDERGGSPLNMCLICQWNSGFFKATERQVRLESRGDYIRWW